MVAAGPVGTVWIEDLGEGTPTSFLLSLDGQRRSPVPGLTNGDVVLDARWSPDGSRIALLTFPGHESIRVVDTASLCIASLTRYSRNTGPSADRPSPLREKTVGPEPFRCTA